MDKEQDLSREELRRRMEETRQSMSETVGEIKQELAEAFEWRTYLKRYPGAFLAGATVAGVVIGRALAADGGERRYRRRERPIQDFEAGDPPAYRAAQVHERTDGGEKSESLVRKAGEVIAATVLAQLAPIVTTTIRKAFGLGPDRSDPDPPRQAWTH